MALRLRDFRWRAGRTDWRERGFSNLISTDIMTLHEQISADLKDAMRAKDAVALATLRALKSALKYAAIEKLGAEGELGEADSLAVVRKQIKQRQDSVEQFTAGNRPELAEKESAELAVLQKFLPAAMSEAEINAAIEEVIAELGATGKQQMGAVMKALQERTAGRADGRTLSAAVTKRLS